MKKRVIIVVVLFMALIGIGLYFTSRVEETIEGEKQSATTATLPKENVITPVSEEISVINVDGSAEKRTRSGAWAPMSKGDVLAVDDSVRTLNESKVLLGLGESSTIELSDASEIEVRELSGAVQRLGLIKGRASVDYSDEGERVLNIENSDGTIVAKVDEGKFSILNNGQLVAVATETGTVDLSSAGENVTVSEGMESVAVKGQAPSTPYKISAEAYLKLASGVCRKQSPSKAIVHGSVPSGTMVAVNRQEVKTNKDGSFITYLKVANNVTRVTLTTTDIWGKVRERYLVCLEPKSRAPIKKIDIDWGQKGAH